MKMLIGAMAAMLVAGVNAAAAEGVAATIADNPQKYLTGSIENAKKHMSGKYTGDGWTWHACYPMNGFIDAYLATKDPAWLEAAATYFDWNIGLLIVSPDGQRGWIGPAYRMEGKLGEHVVGDAIMIEPMVRFAELVLVDEPAHAAKLGDQARAYADLAKQQMFGKWQRRGAYREDGPYAGFAGWPWWYTEQEADRWHEPPAGTSAITLPFNMQVHWGITAARLYRITKDEAWREQAGRLFNLLKSRLCLVGDHYTWNYWEPFGPWDEDPKDPQKFLHWIGTHPYRDYQAGEVKEMVEAFHRGITFDAEDMKRLVNTNVKVMWKGDLEKPEWNNSHAGAQLAAFGEIRLASQPKGIFNRYAGCLWSSLASFDADVRRIYEKQLKPDSIANAFYVNVTSKRAPAYERHFPKEPAKVFAVPFNSCCTLTMVAAMPAVIERGKGSLVACVARVDGDLRIELFDADGKAKVATLREAAPVKAGILNLRWDAKDAKPGKYRLRWKLKEEYREFPVAIR